MLPIKLNCVYANFFGISNRSGFAVRYVGVPILARIGRVIAKFIKHVPPLLYLPPSGGGKLACVEDERAHSRQARSGEGEDVDWRPPAE